MEVELNLRIKLNALEPFILDSPQDTKTNNNTKNSYELRDFNYSMHNCQYKHKSLSRGDIIPICA